MMNSGDDGYQPGDVVVPADGGPLQIAVAPPLNGGPVITNGGGMVIPAGPPIGFGMGGMGMGGMGMGGM